MLYYLQMSEIDHIGSAEAHIGPIDLKQLVVEDVYSIFESYVDSSSPDSVTRDLRINTTDGGFRYLRVRQMNQYVSSCSVDDITLNQKTNITKQEYPNSVALLLEHRMDAPGNYNEKWDKHVVCFISWPQQLFEPEYTVLNAKDGTELNFDDLIEVYTDIKNAKEQLNSKMLYGYASLLLEDSQ